MDSKDIEGIVKVVAGLPRNAQIADTGTNEAKDERGGGRDEARSRSDGGKASDGASAESNQGELLVVAVIEHDPDKATDTGRQVGVDDGLDTTRVGGEGRAAVETEPAEPEESSTDKDKGNIVGHGRRVVVVLALAKDHGVGNSSGSGTDVHGSATGIVHDTHDGQPAVGAPDPVGDDVVDKGAPDEQEQDRRHDAHALGRCTIRQSRSDGGEHELEEEEGTTGDIGGAWVGLPADAPADKVIQVADEWPTSGAEGEGEPPEVPLDRDESDSKD